ncbi:Ger(x)C family spore germination protein [Metabacillus bambusae]|uniref:Ger(X)C family spore germination protein n=1 Tax=Metabacillus bambusae TaxID=2795218 RepID=A0ABS3N8J6_9BACI|nr:Ger(x)C family spore germination protein [Metabacillus bambusae]MBO1514460.1 Ger(x)C family spore germination protein [Metabacillus bambusae]
MSSLILKTNVQNKEELSIKNVILILLSLFLMSGCMNIDKKILDDIQLSSAGGYDYVDSRTVEVTAVTPIYRPDKSVLNETFTTSVSLSKEARVKLNEQSDKPFVSGKIQVALYSSRLAEEGLIDTLDTLVRDPSIGSKVYLVIVEGSAKEFLKKQYGSTDNGIYLSNLIEQNIKSGRIPKTNLHQFKYSYHSEGMDPFLPIIGEEYDKADIKGLALFKQDKFVQHLKDTDMFIFKILYEKSSSDASMELELGEREEMASVYNVNTKRSYDVPKPMTDSKITLRVKFKGIVNEYSGEKINKQAVSKIESKMKEEIEKKGEELIKEFQDLGIDPLGIGDQVRTRTRNWDQKEWYSLYPNVEINVKADVQILETGVIE